MTILGRKCVLGLSYLLLCMQASGQGVDSLKSVQSIYVGSFGNYPGSDDLRQELIDVLKHAHHYQLAQSAQPADAQLEGRGELWIRGYHSLSPRARANSASAEASYAGYLSVKLRARSGEVLWSYLATPPKVGFSDLKHQLASQVVNKLIEESANSTAATAAPAGDSTAAPNATPVILRGAGATFPVPIYQDWFRSFHARHPAWTFDYKAVGSDAGIAQLAAGAIDFAGSDIPPSSPAVLAAIPDARSFPSVGGAVVVIYNLPRIGDDLQLTADVLADILAGKIIRWNDRALREINHGRAIPNAPITVVHRADGSGTTFALTDYLSKTNQPWKQRFGARSRVDWPTGIAQNGNEGVAKSVTETPYSLGYVEFVYAFYHHLSIASIKNAAGRFVAPDLPSIAAAAETANSGPDDGLDLSIVNASAPNAYPISTFSWLVFKDGLDPNKRNAFTSFIGWMLTSGQKECSALGYVPLPQRLLQRELQAAKQSK